MNILGISAFYHDSAACLVRDGEVVAAAQEERFSRKKNDSEFPAAAVRYCLEQVEIEPDQLDFVAYYEKSLLKFERLIETYLEFAPAGFPSFRKALPLWLGRKLSVPRELKRGIGLNTARGFVFLEHHEAHAAAAFFPSPFEEAAIITVDGVGEWATTTYGFGSGREVRLTDEIRFPHSLGLLYSAFTWYCRIRASTCGEYKLMGLAPYGDAALRGLDPRANCSIVKDDGSFRSRPLRTSDWLDSV